MRTRAINAMTNHEITEYLKRKDVIFIPVGTVETHNPYPVDCEYVMAEAWAKLFAEQFDCVYMPNLMYLCSGGTDSICGTVKMSMIDGMKYMYAISRSLLEQGFKRQVYIPGHGPSTLMMHPVIHQILDDTKVPMLFLEPYTLFAKKGLLPPMKFNTTRYWKFKTLSDEEGFPIRISQRYYHGSPACKHYLYHRHSFCQLLYHWPDFGPGRYKSGQAAGLDVLSSWYSHWRVGRGNHLPAPHTCYQCL